MHDPIALWAQVTQPPGSVTNYFGAYTAFAAGDQGTRYVIGSDDYDSIDTEAQLGSGGWAGYNGNIRSYIRYANPN